MSGGTRSCDSPIAERLANFFCELRLEAVPEVTKDTALHDLVDVAGLCIAARQREYVSALVEGWDGTGVCTALGHADGLDAAGAAIVNGTAAHGEDFDDTLEGSPMHVGAPVIPAALAVSERHGRSGTDALRGILAGLEMACRINLVVSGGLHQACFHPTSVNGVFGATVAAGVALGLNALQLTRALGIAGSLCSGVIEYLTEGAWTKRLHAGWAAQSGTRAALLARHGFVGPRTIFEGEHNVFRAFAPSTSPRYDRFTAGLGTTWLMDRIAFKPYPCGTMIHPYIDCMLRLAERGIEAREIVHIECETAPGFVHRLWEPLDAKQRPPNGYAAKFSIPYCMAVAFFERAVGFEQFAEGKVRDPRILELAGKIGYVVDPEADYPANYSGHLRARLANGAVVELVQPHLRGGVREPLSREELDGKFHANVRHGGWARAQGNALLALCLGIESLPSLDGLAQFRR